MVKNALQGFFLALAGAIDMCAPFRPVYEMPLSFKHANDRQDTIIMPVSGQAVLNIFDSCLASLPDDPHNFKLFIGKGLRRFSRHSNSSSQRIYKFESREG